MTDLSLNEGTLTSDFTVAVRNKLLSDYKLIPFVIVFTDAYNQEYRHKAIDESQTFADNLIRVPQALEFAKEEDQPMDELKEYLAAKFKKIDAVAASVLLPRADHFLVQTYLSSRNRKTRDRVFSVELEAYDTFPALSIDFQVLFSPHPKSDAEIPKDGFLFFKK